MIVPNPASAILLFFLGGVFLHFTLAGGRTFYSKDREAEPGAATGQFTFMIGGTVPIWFIGLQRQIPAINGIAAAVVLVLAVALYEWSRRTIWSRRFGLGWGDHVPAALCSDGPYRFIRHPIYLSYMLAYLAAAIALPHWSLAGILAANVALFAQCALHDERRIAASARGRLCRLSRAHRHVPAETQSTRAW